MICKVLFYNFMCDLQGESSVKMPELITMWQSAKSDYTRQWNQLSSAIKGSAIDPIVIDCTLHMEDMVLTAINQMEGKY